MITDVSGRPLTPELIDQFGQPLTKAPATVGIDLYEGVGGDDTLTLLAKIASMTAKNERVGTLVAAPGAVTTTVLKAVSVFNAQQYAAVANRPFTDSDRWYVERAVDRRERKKRKAQKAR
jgi:hypothetical protein